MPNLEPQRKPDIHIIRGDSVTISVDMGMDITGATLFFTVKSELDNDADDSTAVIAKSVSSHDNAAEGETTISLSSSDTDVTPGEYYYDIQLKDGSVITSIAPRKLKIYEDVTRRTS